MMMMIIKFLKVKLKSSSFLPRASTTAPLCVHVNKSAYCVAAVILAYTQENDEDDDVW